MRSVQIGLALARARKSAGLTQAGLADRMGTTQSAVSRAEAGAAIPSPDFIERVAVATGRTITLTFGKAAARPGSRRQRQARVRSVLRGYEFDPFKREPTAAERRSLAADGITRERFQSSRTP